MKMSQRKRGFTLVEMMMAMLAGLVLSLTVGAMLVSGYSAWVVNNDSVKMQNDASLAMLAIGREIRESNIADITIDDVSFVFNPNATGSRINFAASLTRTNATSVSISGTKLVAGGFAVVEDWLNGFTATFNPDASVDVALRLQGGARGSQTTLNATFTPRN